MASAAASLVALSGAIASTYKFLGYSERGITITISPLLENVEADYAGMMPADVLLLGQNATAAGALKRYNETILRGEMSFLNSIAPGGGPQYSIGTLLASETVPLVGTGTAVMAAPPLLLFAPYSFKNIYDSSDMFKSIRFYSAVVGENLPQVWNTRAKAPELNWRAIPIFTSATTPGGALDEYALYAVDEITTMSQLAGALN